MAAAARRAPGPSRPCMRVGAVGIEVAGAPRSTRPGRRSPAAGLVRRPRARRCAQRSSSSRVGSSAVGSTTRAGHDATVRHRAAAPSLTRLTSLHSPPRRLTLRRPTHYRPCDECPRSECPTPTRHTFGRFAIARRIVARAEARHSPSSASRGARTNSLPVLVSACTSLMSWTKVGTVSSRRSGRNQR